MSSKPKEAMNLMRGLPGFKKGFNQVLYKEVQVEVGHGCRSLSEARPSTCTMDSIDKFQPEEYYEKQVTTFPTLMTSLAAVVTKKKSCISGVKVNYFENNWKLSKHNFCQVNSSIAAPYRHCITWSKGFHC